MTTAEFAAIGGTLSFVGCGQILLDAYLPIMPLLGVERVLLFDKDPDRATFAATFLRRSREKLSGEYGHFPDYVNRIDRVRVEVATFEQAIGARYVVVLTPPDDHLEVALAIARSGGIALVEKPFCIAHEEWTALPDVDRRLLTLGARYLENFVFNPAYVELREQIVSGAVGDLLQLRCFLANCGPGPDASWRLQPRRSGGGALSDWGPHTLGLARFLVGMDRTVIDLEVLEHQVTRAGERFGAITLAADLDVHNLTLLSFGGRRTLGALVETSWCASPDSSIPSGETWVEAEGTGGTARVTLRRAAGKKIQSLQVRPWRSQHSELTLPGFPHDSFYFAVLAQLSEGAAEDPRCSVSFGVDVLKLIAQIRERAAS